MLLAFKENDPIEKQALALQAGLGSGSLAQTRATLAQLRQLAGMVGRVGKKSARLQSIISMAIAKAQHQIEALESAESHQHINVSASAKFQVIVYGMMSFKARKFYDAIDEHAKYTIARVGHHGEIMDDDAHDVDGKELRQMMTLIHFHSLDTNLKKKVLGDTFGADAAAEEGTPKNAKILAHKRNELLVLKQALNDMEAYKALIISRKYRPDVAAAMIEKNHNIIKAVHNQIDEVVRRYDVLIDDINDGMAMATVKVAKLKMKEKLKEEVMNQVLLEQPPEAPSISGGISASPMIPAYIASEYAPSNNSLFEQLLSGQ